MLCIIYSHVKRNESKNQYRTSHPSSFSDSCAAVAHDYRFWWAKTAITTTVRNPARAECKSEQSLFAHKFQKHNPIPRSNKQGSKNSKQVYAGRSRGGNPKGEQGQFSENYTWKIWFGRERVNITNAYHQNKEQTGI